MFFVWITTTRYFFHLDYCGAFRLVEACSLHSVCYRVWFRVLTVWFLRQCTEQPYTVHEPTSIVLPVAVLHLINLDAFANSAQFTFTFKPFIQTQHGNFTAHAIQISDCFIRYIFSCKVESVIIWIIDWSHQLVSTFLIREVSGEAVGNDQHISHADFVSFKPSIVWMTNFLYTLQVMSITGRSSTSKVSFVSFFFVLMWEQCSQNILKQCVHCFKTHKIY